MYIVFEGPDGVGKSSALETAYESLRSRLGLKEVVKTFLPGATAVGLHLRTLVKNPEVFSDNISIDPFTRQLLFAADYAAFIAHYRLQLESKNAVVLVDRCSAISSLIYGSADGADMNKLKAIYNAIPAPDIDLLLVFRASMEDSFKRMNDRGKDYFDQKGVSFRERIHASYATLLDNKLLSASSVVYKECAYIDATMDKESVARAAKAAIDAVLS